MKVGRTEINLDYKKPIEALDRKDPFKIKQLGIRTEFMLEKPCKVCGGRENIEIHHIKHLKNLNPTKSKIHELMAKAKRKQVAICKECNKTLKSKKHETKRTARKPSH